MNKLTKKEVQHIAKLANLTLSEEEVAVFSQQLSETLDYIEKLKELTTDGILPTFQTTGLKNITREDVVGPSLTQEEALKNAKATYNGYFKTKAIF